MKRLLAATIVLVFCQVSLAVLPQDYAYQVDLRTYLGTLTASDFTLSLQEMTYNAAYVPTNDDVYKTWVVFQQALPEIRAIRARFVDADAAAAPCEESEDEKNLVCR